MFLVVLLIIVSVVQLSVSIGMFLESKRTNNNSQKVFVGVTVSFLLWTISLIILSLVDSRYSPTNINFFNLLNKIGFSLGALSLMMVYIFNLFFPVKKTINNINKLLIFSGASLSLLSFTNVISGSFSIDSNGKLAYETGVLSLILVAYALIILLVLFYNSFWDLRHYQDKKLRSQVKTILTGFTLTLVHAIVFIVILAPYFNNNIYLYAIGYLAPIYYISFTIFSLFKQKLFDIRFVVVRSLAYILSISTLILLIIIVLFAVSTTLIESNFSKTVQIWIDSIIAISISFVFQPLKKVFDSITNKLFYRDAYETQDLLNEFNKAIVSTIDADQLLLRAGSVIEGYLKPDWVAFALRDSEEDKVRIISEEKNKISIKDIENIRAYVKDGTEKIFVSDLLDTNSDLKKLLQNVDIGAISRVTTDISVEGSGYVILGYKKSGNMYNSQDLGALEILSNELAIAIQNALQFEEIQKFNITLQDKVDEATKELKKSNEKLKQMDETKDEFISMASHQLRTPLTSVKGYLSMVIEGDAGELTQMQKKLLDQAFISSQRMVYLIADLLNVSRLRTGKFIIDQNEVNLAETVDGEVSQLVETAKSRGLELKYRKPKDFPVLLLDETKIRQVIMNFIDNAIYYTPKGGHIGVTLEEVGDSVELRVIDDGLGVPKHEQHNLFSKFFRANNAKKARPDGTGLGLFMAKKVIVAQGGAIIFNSEENKGSTFGFSFSKSKLSPPEIISKK